MNAPLALTEVVCAAALCLFAIGISRGADSSSMRHGPEKNYEQAIPRAELLYQAAQNMCEKAEGSKRELCLKEAKATHIRAVADAKARL
jgi:hypothetical protein